MEKRQRKKQREKIKKNKRLFNLYFLYEELKKNVSEEENNKLKVNFLLVIIFVIIFYICGKFMWEKNCFP